MTEEFWPHRRSLLGGMGAAALAARLPAAPMSATVERWIDVGGAELYVRETGPRDRPAALLAHPVSGSALVWAAQEARYSAAGYRVITWSRRDHARSRTSAPVANPDQTGDLLCIADTLKLDRFHALGTAAGGGVMLDFAVAHPKRVKSLIIANHVGNISDPAFKRRSDALRPPPFTQMPNSFRELGPTYRAADPEGVARWEELERNSRSAPLGPQPPGTLAWADLAKLAVPTLWITGDADHYAPPPLFSEHRRAMKSAQFVVIGAVGHSAYWENPAAFDAEVLAFWTKNNPGA